MSRPAIEVIETAEAALAEQRAELAAIQARQLVTVVAAGYAGGETGP